MWFNHRRRPLSAILIKGKNMYDYSKLYSFTKDLEREMQSFSHGEIDGLTMIKNILKVVTSASDYKRIISDDYFDEIGIGISKFSEKRLFKYIDIDHPKNINKPLKEYYDGWAGYVLSSYYEYEAENPKQIGNTIERLYKLYLMNKAFIENRIKYIEKNPNFVPAKPRRVAF